MVTRVLSVLLLLAVVVVTMTNARETSTGPKTPDEILASVEAKKGFRPPALQLMSERGGVLERFMPYGLAAFEGGPLTTREAYLVAVGAATALKSPTCIGAHTASAIDAGATPDDVIQAMLIAGVVSGTSPLHIAHEVTKDRLQIGE
jgi:AhpD family alkylhydroperoxidase